MAASSTAAVAVTGRPSASSGTNMPAALGVVGGLGTGDALDGALAELARGALRARLRSVM